MRPKVKRTEMPVDLVMAIGLVWGHLRARQFEEAFLLAKGCLRVWPDEHNLILMQSYAAAEVLEPVDVDKLLAIKNASCEEWVRLVLRRAVLKTGSQPVEHGNACAGAATSNSQAVAVACPEDRPSAPSLLPAPQNTTNEESKP